MATTIYTDLKVYDPQFQAGFIETLYQNVNAFNEASRGALALNTDPLIGHYQKRAFWDERVDSQSGIARRDPGSTAAATAIKLTQDEFISVKLNRKNGPYETTLDAFRKAIAAGMSPQEAGEQFSRIIGVQTAQAVPKEMLDRALAAIEAKLDATTALEHTATDGTVEVSDLVSGLAKFGDAAGQIALWVMHSKQFFDLLSAQVTSTATVYASDIFGATVYQGVPATLGRPVLVTDSASLKEVNGVSSGVDKYSILGLTRGAAQLVISEPPAAVLEGPLTGSENLFYRWQAEYAYNLELRGCQWDTTAGGANPTNATVATATNWDTVVANDKGLPGVIVTCR
jgi:hypothetical protein